MSGWVIGWIIGGGVVVAVVVLLVLAIVVAGRAAARAESIASELERARANTAPLWRLQEATGALHRIVEGVGQGDATTEQGVRP